MLFISTVKVTSLKETSWQKKHNLPVGNTWEMTSFFMLSYSFYLEVDFKCYYSKLKIMSEMNSIKDTKETNYLEVKI